MSNSNIYINDIEKKVLECKNYGGNSCNFLIEKIISDTEKKISRDFNVDPTKLKNDFINFIPKNAELGYYGADGQYHKY